jgi:hypothetical protein
MFLSQWNDNAKNANDLDLIVAQCIPVFIMSIKNKMKQGKNHIQVHYP